MAMNIQIYGKAKCFDTRKAQRFFKERGIRFQPVDLVRKGFSPGEFRSVSQAVGGWKNLMDPENSDETALLIRHLADEKAAAAKLMENPRLMRTPIVRNGRAATVGFSPDVWKTWLD